MERLIVLCSSSVGTLYIQCHVSVHDNTILYIPSASNTFNQSIRELYTHKRMDDCHLEIFSICQEGVISIREMKIDFDDGEHET